MNQPTFLIVDRSGAFWTGHQNIWTDTPTEAKPFISSFDAEFEAFLWCPAAPTSYIATSLPVQAERQAS